MLSDNGGSSEGEPYYDDGSYDEGVGSEYTELQIKNAAVQGDLGDALGFDGPVSTSSAYDEGGYTDITLWADGAGAGLLASDRWAMMSAISISNGGIGSDVFAPGAKLHFSSDDYDSVPYVYAWGCSGTGSDADSLDYEASSSEVDIEVSEAEDPGLIHLSITMSYGGYSTTQVVHGELDIARPL
jgi:hypothetical protein